VSDDDTFTTTTVFDIQSLIDKHDSHIS